MLNKVILPIFLGLIMYPLYCLADDDQTAQILKTLAKMIPGEAPDSITATPIPNFYEVSFGAEIFYMTSDGRFMLKGDVVDLEQKINLTETKRSTARVGVISSIDERTMISFSPKKVKHVVSVFTDIDCPYCRKMHDEMAEYNRHGIEIRYLAYPRSGINTPSYYKAVSVWCAEDRQKAMTTSKSGGHVEDKTCDDPVRLHMTKANEVGVSGTPTIVLEDGSVLPGYVPAQQLSTLIEERIGNL